MTHRLPHRPALPKRLMNKLTHRTPLTWVWITVSAGLSFLALQTWVALQVPTLGVTLAASESDSGAGLLVTAVRPELPAARAGVQPGMVIRTMTGAGETLDLHPNLLLLDPNVPGNYTTVNAFRRDVAAATRMLDSGPVRLILADGRTLQVTAQAHRPLGALPFWYWAVSVMGVIALAIGAALKSHSRDNGDSTLVLLASWGFWLTAWTWPLYGPRELAAPLADWLIVLEAMNHLGFVVMFSTGIALLWQYPNRLGPRSALPVSMGVGLFLWLLITGQWLEFPWHAYYVPLFCVPFAAACVLAVLQIRASRGRPLEYASLRWLLLSILGSTTGAFALYAVPPLFGAEPMAPPWLTQATLLIFFLGLAFGAARYRLFSVERWWVNTWVWFFMGAAIIVLDVALINVLHLGPASSIGLAVVLVGWVYFPLRQLIWARVAPSSQASAWDMMPEVAQRFGQSLTPREAARQLAETLERRFSAPDAVVLDAPPRGARPRLTHHGLSLVTPAPFRQGQVVLTGKDRGRRLFDRNDLRFVANLLLLIEEVLNLSQQREAAERKERERVMRDIHDDVGARLLTLVHGAEDRELREEAAEILLTLRTSVFPLNNRGATPLTDAAARWRGEFDQRAARAGVTLRWSQSFPEQGQLNARQYVNVSRILREVLTNALKHAGPDFLAVSLRGGQRLVATIMHNGQFEDPVHWRAGAGLHNLRNRASEIDGSICFATEQDTSGQRLRTTLEIPL